jgi:hypothetical protein
MPIMIRRNYTPAFAADCLGHKEYARTCNGNQFDTSFPPLASGVSLSLNCNVLHTAFLSYSNTLAN